MTDDASSRITHAFQAEVKQLLQLMIHSLYGNKEIFLRELISNAADAADKLRYAALTDDALYEGDAELKITLAFDPAARTLTLRDNGIGMSREEVRENIGTIARSGTREFFQSLTGDEARDSQLIGQFGVGFYSAFIVADRVTLTTRRAGTPAEQGARWESAGDGEYTLETRTVPWHGTEVVLHMKEGEDEFLDGWKLRALVRKFSDHIALPIVMPKDGGEEDAEEKAVAWETVNSASALWAKSRDDIAAEQYDEFYKHIAHDFQAPLAHLHSRVEGSNEFTLLLYLPAHAPFDLWDREARHGVKLYVRRVFVMEGSEKLMPRYLRFVRGVIDSDSLPLNVSREILQDNAQLDKIRAGAVKKVLGLLEDLAGNEPDKYARLWAEFGPVLKEGVIEDFRNRDRVARLLRFSSTHTDGETQDVRLDEYLGRMKEGQEKIYYVTAETFTQARNSPHLEVFRKKGIEVLLLADRIDEWLVGHLSDYEGKPLESVTRADLNLGALGDGADAAAEEKAAEEFADVVARLRQTLDGKVQDVRLSHRLTESPACLVSAAHGMSRTLERILKSAGQQAPATTPVLEINPAHALVTRLAAADPERFADLAWVLFDQAVLAEGGQLDDPAAFVQRLGRLL